MPVKDKIVLSYGDIVLRESDAELLDGSHWLNDNIIDFWFEYLTNVKDYEPCLFIGPGVTHCLKASDSLEEMSAFLDPLGAKSKNIIFFALNDHQLFNRSGGMHWSLLVYSKLEKVMCHYDSSDSANMLQAKQLAKKLSKYLLPGEMTYFEDVECLQQDNAYDCGIFVICHTSHLMNYFIKDGNIIGCPKMCRADILNKRKELLNLITELSN